MTIPSWCARRARLGMVLQDKWTLDALLGVGGMAAVYAATHRNGKRVAVKVLHAEMSHDDEVKQRFLQEGYAANTIQHEGAVSVLDDDVAADGSAFIVMELLEGETVERRWERSGQRLPAREVLAIVEQLLDVLAAAHAKNVVHRDIKPENLFITQVGQLKVLDFGIARVFEAQRGRATTTRAGVVMGTPAFMAPEQARARWDEVDGRTDLWAVGATMFTLLSGRHVHEGVSGNEQLILSATTPAPSLASVEPDVPRGAGGPGRSRAGLRSGEALAGRGVHAARGERGARGAGWAGHGGAVVGETPGDVHGAERGGDDGAFGHQPGRCDADRHHRHARRPSCAWAKEREQRAAEAARLRASIADLSQRYAASKKRVADAQATAGGGPGGAVVARALAGAAGGHAHGSGGGGAEADARPDGGHRAAGHRRPRGVRGGAGPGARRRWASWNARRRRRRATSMCTRRRSRRTTRARSVWGCCSWAVAAVLLLALIVVPIVWRATRVVDAPPPLPVRSAPALPLPR